MYKNTCPYIKLDYEKHMYIKRMYVCTFINRCLNYKLNFKMWVNNDYSI